MARDKESMQDIALYHMDKMNRNSAATAKPKTLAEQLADLERTPEQIRRESSHYDWHHDLRDFCVKMKHGPGDKLIQFVLSKYKTDMEQFHKKGSNFKEVAIFIQSKLEEFMNY